MNKFSLSCFVCTHFTNLTSITLQESTVIWRIANIENFFKFAGMLLWASCFSMKLQTYWSSHPDVSLEKGILKICSKFTGDDPCQSVISKCKVGLQLYWNRTSARMFSCRFTEYFQNTFSQERLWRVVFGGVFKILSYIYD